jgi:thioredoxin-related protein
MKDKALIFIVIILTISAWSCKEKDEIPTLINGELNWLTIADIESMDKPSSKMYLVDIYTDWCVWCKVMDKNTFSDPEIKAYLDKYFHVAKFNAEGKESVQFNGKNYEWIPAGRNGINKLALEMLSGRPSYPSIVFLDEKKQKVEVAVGYHDPEKMMAVLKDLVAGLGKKG